MSQAELVASQVDLATIEAELRPQSSEKLKLRFFECYSGAATVLAEAAVCVKLLKERGDSLVGVPMVGTFLRIASGQILPELVWKFIESPNRQRVERLPLDDQKRIAADPMVPVVEPKADRGFTTRMIDLAKAPAEVAKLVAGPDGIRSPEEQIAHLCSHKPKAVVAVPVAKDEPAEEPLDKNIRVKLTSSDLEALKIHAALAHVSETEMARRFLVRAGAFKRPRT